MIPKHLRPRLKFLQSLPVCAPPSPWEKVGTHAVGGLIDVGFETDSDLLLVLSSGNGRGVFDCLNGARVGRDYDQDYPFNTQSLIADSMPPMREPKIRTAGLHGGGLAKGTEDGWHIEKDPTLWPHSNLYLFSGSQRLFWKREGENDQVTKVASDSGEVRVFGFSPTGRSFIVAYSSDLEIYSRKL